MTKLTTRRIKKRETKEPLWKGPEEDGVTQSMLGRFLCCRERFRLLVVEGLAEADGFNHRIEYGNMWHVCEEEFASSPGNVMKGSSKNQGWENQLRKYCQKLCAKYPLAQEQIDKWYNVCKLQFPIYVKYWGKHPDVKPIQISPSRAMEQANCWPRTPR